jgi:hypothetical protein
VNKQLVFEAPGSTPRNVCEGFFAHIYKIVNDRVKDISYRTGIKFAPIRNIALVYPPKQGRRYVEELTRIVRETFGAQPKYVLNSTQAIGLLAFHKRMFIGEERALIFDIGDETISVAKTWLNDNDDVKAGILADSRKAHSEPYEIGGSDIDKNISNYIDGAIYERETMGSPSSGTEGHIYESGIFANQYLLMKDIKKSKAAMQLINTEMFKDGVPINVHREVLLQRLISEGEFFDCVGIGRETGVAAEIVEYILRELSLKVNRDVTKIIFAGGTIETHGLLDYIKEKLSEEYSHISIYKFDEPTDDGDKEKIQFYEASAYASSLGGAMVAMCNYSVDSALSYSYGAYCFPNGIHSNPALERERHLRIFAERGSVLKGEKTVFRTDTDGEGNDINLPTNKWYEGLDEYELYSMTINTKEIQANKYSHLLEYDNVQFARGGSLNYLVIGKSGSECRRKAEEAVSFKVVAGGERDKITFYYKGEQVALKANRSGETQLKYTEGFAVDQDGHATPFFNNLTEKNNFPVMAKSMRTNAIHNVLASEIEFRIGVDDIVVTED